MDCLVAKGNIYSDGTYKIDRKRAYKTVGSFFYLFISLQLVALQQVLSALYLQNKCLR